MRTKNILTFSKVHLVVLFLTSAVGLLGFLWPFLISTQVAHPQWIFLCATPLALAVFLISVSNGSLDAKSVALLALLSALVAALRPLGTGAVGLEPMWFLLILSARVFGPSFGFLLGVISMLLPMLCRCLDRAGSWIDPPQGASKERDCAADSLRNYRRRILWHRHGSAILAVVFGR